MPRLLPPTLIAPGILLLAGCAQPGVQPPPLVPPEPHSYVCKLPAARPAAGGELRAALRADDARTGFELRIGTERDWHALALVAGSNGRIYADAAYAWRPDGTGGVLTDVRNIQTYACAGDSVAAVPAK